MGPHEFYYRLKPLGIDYSNKKDIVKYNDVLNSFNDLSEQFDALQRAFDQLEKTRADIIINVLPDISGVVEISVYHKIKFKFFSQKVKQNVFSLSIDKYDSDGKLSLFSYETSSLDEVKFIFRDFIDNNNVADLDKWYCTYIG